MEKQDLRSIFDRHTRLGSDKWTSYFGTYDRHFAEYRDRPVTLLEIGVQNGGSLEIWGNYFPKATRLIGCDIDEKCRALSFEDPRIRVVVGDANDDQIHSQIIADTPGFDIIIDDGSHVVEDVLRSFSLYFPALKPGGLYVIEDLHTSYWVDYGGGSDLQLTSMGFLKLLADIASKDFWHEKGASLNLLEPFARRYGLPFEQDNIDIEEISFSNSVCVIKKGSRGFENRRHIAGGTFDVVDLSASRPLSGTRELVEMLGVQHVTGVATEMQRQFVQILPRAIEDHADAARLPGELSALKAELEKVKRENAALLASTSWRVTAPLRRMSEALRGR